MVKKLLRLSAVLLLGAGLVIFPERTSNAAFNALNLCGRVVIPSLFPFLVLSSFVIKSSLTCGFKSAYINTFILGAAGGYPVGASVVCELYSKKQCTKEQAETMLAFCNNCGPAFIFGAVGGAIFKSLKIGILLYFIHIVSAIFTGLIFTRNKSNVMLNTSSPEIGAFPNAVKSGATSTINICAFVIFFSVLCEILNFFNILPAVCVLFGGSEIFEVFIIGILELTSGICRAPATPGGFVLCSTLLGFGGFSVHAQALSFICKSNLSTKKYFLGKALHTALSFILSVLLVIFKII